MKKEQLLNYKRQPILTVTLTDTNQNNEFCNTNQDIGVQIKEKGIEDDEELRDNDVYGFGEIQSEVPESETLTINMVDYTYTSDEDQQQISKNCEETKLIVYKLKTPRIVSDSLGNNTSISETSEHHDQYLHTSPTFTETRIKEQLPSQWFQLEGIKAKDFELFLFNVLNDK